MSSFSSPLQDDFANNPFGLPDPPIRTIPTDSLQKIIFAFEACRNGIQQSQFSNYSVDSIVWCLKTIDFINKKNGEVTQNGENQVDRWKKQKNVDSMGQIISLFIKHRRKFPEFEIEIANHFENKHVYVDYFRHSSLTEKLHWLNFLFYLGFMEVDEYKLIDVCDRKGKRFKWTDSGKIFIVRIKKAIAPKDVIPEDTQELNLRQKIIKGISTVLMWIWKIFKFPIAVGSAILGIIAIFAFINIAWAFVHAESLCLAQKNIHYKLMLSTVGIDYSEFCIKKGF